MTILGLDHIGVAVHNLDAAVKRFQLLAGPSPFERSRVPDQGVSVVFLTIGNTQVELLAPLSPDTPVGRFLDRHGEGFHHIAWAVDDLQAELTRLRNDGYQLIDSSPRRGVHGLIGFVHPRSCGGVLTEFVQRLD